jgi:hypothetical protein
MAKTNYSFAKRQRDLAKQQQRDAKRERKAAAKQTVAQPAPPADAPAGHDTSGAAGAAPGTPARASPLDTALQPARSSGPTPDR